MDNDISMDHMDILGHNFLDTIDLDIMEQTIIDDVMAEISTTEQPTWLEPIIPRNYSDSMVTTYTASPEAVVPLSTLSPCKSEPVMKCSDVIKATDVEALLEQFEEAANDLSVSPPDAVEEAVVVDSISTKPTPPVFTLFTDDAPVTKDTNGNIPKKELTSEVLQKIKASRKPKTTVMLPMVVPAKRGRGRAMTRGHPVAMPANCTPRRLQRVIMQNTELKDSLALMEVVEVTDGANRDLSKERKMESLLKKSDILATVSSTAVTPVTPKETATVIDHTTNTVTVTNEITNTVTVTTEPSSVTTLSVNNTAEPRNGPEVKIKLDETISDENYFEHPLDHDYIKSSPSTSGGSEVKTENVGDFEEGEILDESQERIIHENSGYNERDAYDRKLKSREEESDNSHQLFDKLPSYCTALSIPRKQVRKTASCVTGRGGITIQDYLQRDISPIRDDSTYNKVPDYFSSFTNSTRYDSVNEDRIPKYSEDSKASSGYSSMTHSPDFECPSRSRSNSHSRSRSRSQSKPVNESTRSRRQSSYSSCSGYSSSSSSCSNSSCDSDCSCSSRSSSPSLNRSASSSSSCSTCSSRSPSRSLSRSPDRSWIRERKLRAERSRKKSRSRRLNKSPRSSRRDRDRSRSSRYSSRRSRSREYRSRSRSRSVHKIRSASMERFREERKKQREQEKEQQMKERRIVYVGGLPAGYSRHTLRDKFVRFGPIERVQLHFREHGDNYGFVTFTYTCDAYAAIEKGRRLPGLEKFDLCFGGRRQFCDVEYADLDGNKEIEEEFDSKPQSAGSFDFDELLRQAKAKIKKS